jgi:sulfur carrier protein ThiS
MTLELGGGDLETTDFHDLLEPVDDKEVVILVNNDFVPRPDPSENTLSSIPSMLKSVTETYPSTNVSLVLRIKVSGW